MKKEAVAVFKLVQIYMSDRKAKVTLFIIIIIRNKNVGIFIFKIQKWTIQMTEIF